MTLGVVVTVGVFGDFGVVRCEGGGMLRYVNERGRWARPDKKAPGGLTNIYSNIN